MATFYIDPDVAPGGVGSIGDPFADTTEATMGTNNTFLFKYGTTHTIATILFNANLGADTVLGAYGTASLGKPILTNSTGADIIQMRMEDGSGQTVTDLHIKGTGTGNNGINIYHTTYDYDVDRNITISDCEFSNHGQDNLRVLASGVTVSDCTFSDAGRDNIYFEGKNNIFDNLNCSTPDKDLGGIDGDNIQGEKSQGVGGNNIIRNCILDKTGTAAKQNIKIENGDGNVIHNNTIINDSATSTGVACNDGTLIRDNTFTGGRFCINMQANSAGAIARGNDVIATSVTERGINMEGADGLIAESNVIDFVNASASANAAIFIYNNDGAIARHNTIIGSPTEVGINSQHATLTTGVTLTNNIVTGCLQGMKIKESETTETYNILYGNTTNIVDGADAGVTPNATDILTDPQIDANGKPSASSPAFAAGKIIFGARDYRGRSFKYPPTIGAYSFTSGDVAQVRTAREGW